VVKLNIFFNIAHIDNGFYLPNCIVNDYIKLANETQLKVLLFVFCNKGNNFSIDDISKNLGKHPDEISDSLNFWGNLNIIKIDDKTHNHLPDSQSISSITKEVATILPEYKISKVVDQPQRPVSKPQKPDSAFLAKRMKESDEIPMLMQEAQIILGKPISTADCSTLLMLHETDGLPCDVILMLLQYSRDAGKPNMRYIEKVGISWASEGIDNMKSAENKIKQLNNMHKAWNTIVSVTGIDYHNPTANESKYADKWVNDWNFTPEMIREAYERCIDNTGKFLCKYINKVLDSWHKNGITTLEQAKIEEKPSNKNKSDSYGKFGTTYDLEAYEKSSIFD
jgi:DnaD/phage-associated family protein